MAEKTTRAVPIESDDAIKNRSFPHRALGGPSIEPRWTHGAKLAVGTAYSTSSQVWYTLDAGCVSMPTVSGCWTSFDKFNSKHNLLEPTLQILRLTVPKVWHMACLFRWLRKAPMLKISIVDGHTQRRLIVEGKLVGPWAAELKSACEKARADLRPRELVLDMKHLTAISQEGENVLLELLNDGIKFRCWGVFTKHVLKQLNRRATRNQREANQ